MTKMLRPACDAATDAVCQLSGRARIEEFSLRRMDRISLIVQDPANRITAEPKQACRP
jgi:hypothetical protein